MNAHYLCRACKLEWEGEPGPTDCSKCREPHNRAVTWTNFEEWEKWAQDVGIRPVSTVRPWRWPDKAVWYATTTPVSERPSWAQFLRGLKGEARRCDG